MERLLMREPVTHLTVQSGAVESRLVEETVAREPHSIKYLSECYLRLCDEANLVSKNLFKVCYVLGFNVLLAKCVLEIKILFFAMQYVNF